MNDKKRPVNFFVFFFFFKFCSKYIIRCNCQKLLLQVIKCIHFGLGFFFFLVLPQPAEYKDVGRRKYEEETMHLTGASCRQKLAN